MKATSTVKLITIATLSALLVACGGGSGTDGLSRSSTDEQSSPSNGLPPSVGDAPIDGTLPDFSVVSLTTSSSTFTNNFLNIQAVITNTGDRAAAVPDGWFVTSQNSADTSDYLRTGVSFLPVGLQEPTLQPGESGIFEASSAGRAGLVQVEIVQTGTYFGELILNPELSQRYLNPESFVTESYSVEELDYENNRSDLVTFEVVSSTGTERQCVVDAFEQNDSDELATSIVTGVIYEFNACDEGYEVIAIDLVAGATYEVEQRRSAVFRAWQLTLVGPEGDYLFRDERRLLFTPQQSGRYLIIARIDALATTKLLLEVVEQ